MDGMKTEWGNGWNGNPFPLSEQGLRVVHHEAWPQRRGECCIWPGCWSVQEFENLATVDSHPVIRESGQPCRRHFQSL